jgi:endonuclease/exonuclease/phosphatase family metal-dependent hydrolase
MGTSQRTSVGTAILLDRTTAPLVVESGIFVEGRAQFVKLQATDEVTLTVINVYATRTSRERAPLWKAISSAECNSNHTILGGDFNNMVEIPCGGLAGYRRMHRREAASWHQMTIQYGLSDAWVSDSFRKMSKKVYTFDNGRSGSGAAVSKIDKYMISQGLESRGGRIKTAASIEKISDHSPLLISIWGQATDPVNPSYYFDTSLLEDAKAKAELLQAWSGDLPTRSNN